MWIMNCEVIEEARYLVCFTLQKITFLMCCSSELSCPMTVIPCNNIFTVTLQVFTKFFISWVNTCSYIFKDFLQNCFLTSLSDGYILGSPLILNHLCILGRGSIFVILFKLPSHMWQWVAFFKFFQVLCFIYHLCIGFSCLAL